MIRRESTGGEVFCAEEAQFALYIAWRRADNRRFTKGSPLVEAAFLRSQAGEYRSAFRRPVYR